MATAIASLFSGRKVKPLLAMTGEVTLTGRVLPVGGIKEKVLGARRAGIRTVILPERNRKDVMEDLPKEIQKELHFDFVEDVRQVLDLALEPKTETAVGEEAGSRGRLSELSGQEETRKSRRPQAARPVTPGISPA
jgi:ATP-dependent Lon protease